MELREIDERLQHYSAAERRIGANLHDLELDSTYQILATDTLHGQTGKRLNPSFQASPSIWQMYQLLSDALDQARSLRGTGTRVKADVRRSIAEILTGTPIRIDLSETPMAGRHLTSGGPGAMKISIETLLTRMRTAYEPIRDGVAAVEAVMRQLLPRLDAADTTLRKAAEDAAGLRIRAPEIDRALDELDELRTLATEDPLAIPSDAADEFERKVRHAASTVASQRQSRDELQADLGRTSELLAEIRDLRSQAVASRERALTAIVAPLGLVHVPGAAAIDGAAGLGARLGPILDSAAPWQDVRGQLDVWLRQATRLRDQLSRAARVNRDPLDRRSELRGRLSAYRAKMAGTGRAEDGVLREIADEAHNELFTAPTDLGRAEQLVSELGRQLGAV